jgi:zinc protease
MVVSGDVTLEEVVKLAEQYIEPIPSAAPPPPITTKEPDQLGERRIVVRKLAQLPLLQIGYHVPATSHADYYPLQLLETVLFSGQSSRMYRRLVDKDQIALSVSGGSDFAFDPTIFEMAAQPKAGVDPATVEKAIYEELAKVANEPVSDAEIEKAKNMLLSGFYGQIRTISGRSDAIGTYEVFFGDYKKLFSAADDLATVTKADVQRVAQTYFGDRNRTVATLLPDAPAAKK